MGGPLGAHRDARARAARAARRRPLRRAAARAVAARAGLLACAPRRLPAGGRALVPQHLSQLRGRDFVMTIHPMDLALQGKTHELVVVRGAIVRELTFTDAYQTWTKEAQSIEDELTKAAEWRVPLQPIAD